MTNKTAINAILKKGGYSFVKIFGTGDFSNTTKVFRDNGETRKGIKGWSSGPMTMSFQKVDDENEKILKQVKKSLFELSSLSHPVKENEMMFFIKGKHIRYTFYWERFPTYSRSANLDSSYVTYWLTINTETIK
jgi:hypothetical protein